VGKLWGPPKPRRGRFRRRGSPELARWPQHRC
jgi:hypothetical protein